MKIWRKTRKIEENWKLKKFHKKWKFVKKWKFQENKEKLKKNGNLKKKMHIKSDLVNQSKRARPIRIRHHKYRIFRTMDVLA